MNDYKVDLERLKNLNNATGIYIRAHTGQKWESVDIATLDAESLNRWLRSKPDLAVNVVLCILGHPQPHIHVSQAHRVGDTSK